MVKQNKKADQQRRREKKKPDPSIEGSLDGKSELGSLLVPEAIVVGCLNDKAIVSGREIGVGGRTAGSGFGPLPVEAFEAVAIANLHGSDEAEPGVFECEAVVSRRDIHAGGLFDAIDGEALDDDRRGNPVQEEVGGVNDSDAFAGGEPERSVGGLPCARIAQSGDLF